MLKSHKREKGYSGRMPHTAAKASPVLSDLSDGLGSGVDKSVLPITIVEAPSP